MTILTRSSFVLLGFIIACSKRQSDDAPPLKALSVPERSAAMTSAPEGDALSSRTSGATPSGEDAAPLASPRPATTTPSDTPPERHAHVERHALRAARPRRFSQARMGRRDDRASARVREAPRCEQGGARRSAKARDPSSAREARYREAAPLRHLLSGGTRLLGGRAAWDRGGRRRGRSDRAPRARHGPHSRGRRRAPRAARHGRRSSPTNTNE